MKKQDQDEKRSDRYRSVCSMSGLLLSVVCCIALIHVELRIQEHHRLISHSVTTCDQLETQILRKVQQNYGRWQDHKDSHSQGHWEETRGTFRSCRWQFQNILIPQCTGILVSLNSVCFCTHLCKIFVTQNFNFVDQWWLDTVRRASW